MFKSRIPLQTPIIIKLLLSLALAAFFAGWFFSSEASSQESPPKDSSIVRSKLKSNQTNEELIQIAKLTHQKVSNHRASLNLVPLKFDAFVSEQAKAHSLNMAQQIVEFSHAGFQSRADALKDTISYSSVAENVAYNMGYQDPVNTAVKGWIESNGHRKNIEGNYNLTGIGVAVNPDGEYYFTQIFILEN